MTSLRSKTSNRKLGLPVWGIIGLALLAVPRVVLHDLHIIEEGSFINALFVFVPPLTWIAVAALMRIRRPFVTLLVVGICYGVFLAVGHLLSWGEAFPEGPPQLGGNLADVSSSLQGLILRGFAVVASLVTGTLVGAVCGLVAAGISTVLHRPQARRSIDR